MANRTWKTWAWLAVLSAVVSIPGLASAQENPPDEQAAVARDRSLYAGTWRLISLESDGEVKPADGRAVVVENRLDGGWTMSVDGLEVSRGESRIDPLADPPEIDIEFTAGDGKGRVLRGIYRFDEQRRRLCFRGEQGWRPREFRTQPGDGAVLVTFEKQTDVSGP